MLQLLLDICSAELRLRIAWWLGCVRITRLESPEMLLVHEEGPCCRDVHGLRYRVACPSAGLRLS